MTEWLTDSLLASDLFVILIYMHKPTAKAVDIIWAKTQKFKSIEELQAWLLCITNDVKKYTKLQTPSQ